VGHLRVRALGQHGGHPALDEPAQLLGHAGRGGEVVRGEICGTAELGGGFGRHRTGSSRVAGCVLCATHGERTTWPGSLPIPDGTGGRSILSSWKPLAPPCAVPA